jgi:HEAT repeat protein
VPTSAQPLDRSAALVALGWLNATNQVASVAKHLDDGEGFVQRDAAVALVLLDAREHAKAVVGLLPKPPEGFLKSHRTASLSREEARTFETRLKTNYERLRAAAPKP